MKTSGMAHQVEALRRAGDRAYFAYFMEQGTGKTWTLLADAERMYAAGRVDAIFVLAPNGVHTNWIQREIPQHLAAHHISRAWRSGAGVKATARLEELFALRKLGEVVPLRILAMNIEAINSEPAFNFAIRFLRATRAMIIVDESTRIKNPGARRTARATQLRALAEVARIASGRPNPQSPLDFFGQMEFLRAGLLGTSSFRAFTAEYAETVDMASPEAHRMVAKNPRAAFAQIVAKDPVTGAPRYRNLDRLQALVSEQSFRVLKKDCLDLPAKIYQQTFFDLAHEQRRAYNTMRKEQRIVLDDAETSVSKLAALIKLQQITSGFVLVDGAVAQLPQLDKNPRLEALLEILRDEEDTPVIVWARFREELRLVSETLRAAGRRVVEYHGAISGPDRERAVDDFQSGKADAFVANPQSAGIGLTLTRAELAVYYSNDFNLETRLQSEDRNHRIGTVGSVRYLDLVARATIDEVITAVLQRKERLSSVLLGDQELLAAVTGDSF